MNYSMEKRKAIDTEYELMSSSTVSSKKPSPPERLKRLAVRIVTLIFHQSAYRVHSVEDHVDVLELFHAGGRQHVHYSDDVVVVELPEQSNLADHALCDQHVVKRRNHLTIHSIKSVRFVIR